MGQDTGLVEAANPRRGRKGFCVDPINISLGFVGVSPDSRRTGT